ncbi:hypothetical protein RB195_021543 [Necator americanus]|uniref:Uncharacterized protein n=2 Tax=Necator americanus TaxID=51031 RepID=A0ABR1EBT5_NECAM
MGFVESSLCLNTQKGSEKKAGSGRDIGTQWVDMIFLYLLLGVVSASVLQYDPRTTLTSLLSKRLSLPSYLMSHYDKRTLDFDDPRLFSSAFGKRSGFPARSLSFQIVKRSPYFGSDDSEDTYEKRDGMELMDPRFFTNSFGKRSDFLFDDPRFSSVSFGKRR